MPESTVAPVPSTVARLSAEALGTFFLVFSVIGTALFAAGFGSGQAGLNVGFLGVSIALGFSVVIGAYAFGPISGGHFNPAVTLGLAAAGRFAWRDVASYVIAQVIGGLVAAALLAGALAGGKTGTLAEAQKGGFASTGWGELSPGGYGMGAFFLVEVVATALFVTVILAVTGKRGAGDLAPIAIGLTLTVVALVAIPVSNGSFNPARSIATAVFGGGTALTQLWGSIMAPTVGGLLAGFTNKYIFERDAK